MQSIRDVLLSKEGMFEIKRDFEDNSLKSIDIEGQLRRGKIDLQDRQVLHVHVLHDVEKSKKALSVLKALRENLLADLTICENEMVASLALPDSFEIAI